MSDLPPNYPNFEALEKETAEHPVEEQKLPWASALNGQFAAEEKQEPVVIDPQEEFERTYITSSEIMERLEISRTTLLYARRRNILPEPITVNNGQILLWKRSDIKRNLEAWELMLKARRREL